MIGVTLLLFSQGHPEWSVASRFFIAIKMTSFLRGLHSTGGLHPDDFVF
jgi:hypothetical protein